nr:FCD domain-containing protein [Anaerolineales bacterium]
SPANFRAFSELRNRIEAGFWCEAVAALTPEDHAELQNCIALAWEKLNGTPIRIPHPEHRKLHLTIFSRLDNPFVRGLLEAYWEAYEAVELDSYADYAYLREVWGYHQSMVEAIVLGDVEASKQAFIEHTGLLRHRPH